MNVGKGGPESVCLSTGRFVLTFQRRDEGNGVVYSANDQRGSISFRKLHTEAKPNNVKMSNQITNQSNVVIYRSNGTTT